MKTKRLLILSGPTHEYIDPVRFIGNSSSGLMGKAIAEAAQKNGFEVCFITGPICTSNLPELPDDALYPVCSADQMLATASDRFEWADAVIFAAAVADYKPSKICAEKIVKSDQDLTLTLCPTPDIAKTLGAKKRPNQTLIGFALQTINGPEHARRKLKEKQLHGIVLNTPASLGANEGTFTFITPDSEQNWGTLSKTECAQRILDFLRLAVSPS